MHIPGVHVLAAGFGAGSYPGQSFSDRKPFQPGIKRQIRQIPGVELDELHLEIYRALFGNDGVEFIHDRVRLGIAPQGN